jgi:hypothetical protein
MPLFYFPLELLSSNNAHHVLCFRSAEITGRQNALAIPLLETFPNSLNEIGRESGNVTRSFRGAQAWHLCNAQNLYDRRRLVVIA